MDSIRKENPTLEDSLVSLQENPTLESSLDSLQETPEIKFLGSLGGDLFNASTEKPAVITDEMIQQVKSGLLGLTPDWSKKSKPFFIMHETSNMVVVPSSENLVPGWNTACILKTYSKPYPNYALFEYVPLVAPFAGWGLLIHYTSQKSLVPFMGSENPGEGTTVVVADSLHIAHLFTYLSEKNTFTHLGGLNWNPQSRRPRPGQREEVKLFKNTDMAAWMTPKDAQGQTVEVHGAKVAGGKWVRVFQVDNPMTQITKSLEYKEGFTQSQQKTVEVSIESSISAKFAGIGASLKYSTKFGFAQSKTWSKEIKETMSFTIFPGKSICKYQYIFHGNYDTFNLNFQSSIFADTDCTFEPQNIWDEKLEPGDQPHELPGALNETSN